MTLSSNNIDSITTLREVISLCSRLAAKNEARIGGVVKDDLSTVGQEPNNRARPYEIAPREAQSYQSSLPYREGKRVERTASDPDRGQEPNQLRNMFFF